MSGRHLRQARADHGFSLIELSVVVLIGLVVTTMAMPNMLTVIANTRLRGNISTLSGIYQNCRMMAIKNNRTMTTRFNNSTNGIMAYVKAATDNSAVTRTDTQVELQKPIVRYTAAALALNSGPAGVSSSALGFTPASGDPSFNSRGLPCAYSGGTCTNQGFIAYFKDTRRAGMTGWAAVSISPAGRIKKWFWNGSAWAD
ncbi:MAG TPA: prepilin-type N-terminal cleavage/methylation domain-containing protein [Terriglobia bacterium]|nr:prepilin-type N-terminal cleavage/methylation domain-containing protein [Terriglobia bacterium]